jgi:TolA-binding protein
MLTAILIAALVSIALQLHTNRRLKKMEEAVARLTASVSALTTVDQSAITLINGLSQQIRDLSADPAALNALADQLDAQASDLSAAVTANTPATPEEPTA